ncbi:hypothetical protein ACQEVF_59020 [Nonomuraea polychroma]|uniref:hypothetical protein n=1 Tax=Nonomuraea polychroma TaxID=46176 RepID=UPI003D948F21
MNELDDIARRLDAVAGIDWTVTRQDREEYYGDWIHVGPIMMTATDPDEKPWRRYPNSWPQQRRREYQERISAERAEQDAVIEFVQHAAADIAYLLTQIDSTATARTSDDA